MSSGLSANFSRPHEMAAELDDLKYLVFEGMAGKAPRINTTNYYWEVYDNNTKTWVDTGVSAVNGAPGQDGYTPTISVAQGTDGITVTISDGRPNGTTASYYIPNGQDYVLTNADKQEIADLLDDGVPTLVTDWLDDNVTPVGSAVVVDSSLSIAGAAADAAMVGAALQRIQLPDEVKQTLLACFENVAWISDDGQDYYDALEEALYPPSDLVSISAVFTQGSAVIYETDSLDTLKQYLVVTAYFDDLSSQTIAGYSLSGTLAVGTSTITVSYGGKTTTFNVTVSEYPVPEEYQSVEWVGSQSSRPADSGPYILTNISESDKASLNGYSITITAICDVPVQAQGTVNGMMIGFAQYYGTYFGSVQTGKMAINLSPELNVNCSEKNTYNLSFSATGLTVTSGTESVHRDYSTSAFAPRLWIGTGFVQANVSTSLRIYNHVVVKKNGVLVGDFYPCYRKSDNAIGFYDSVSDSFFTNASASGTFLKGDNI